MVKNTRDYEVRFTASGGAQVTSTVNSVNKAVKILDSEIKKSFDTSSAEKMSRVLDLQRQKVELLTGELKREQAALDKLDSGSDAWIKQNAKVAQLTQQLNRANNSVDLTTKKLESLSGVSFSSITSSAKQLWQNMKPAINIAGETAESLLNLGNRTAQAAGVIAGVGIGALVTGVVKEANDGFNNLQALQATYDFAGRTKEDLDRAYSFIQKYAADTEFSASDITNAWTQMGLDSSEASEQLVSGLGGIVQASKEPAQALKLVLAQMTQVHTLGKLQYADWKVIEQDIQSAPIANAIEEQMRKAGAFTGDFQEAMKNGEISADEFDEAIRQVGNNDALQKQAYTTQTLSGAWGQAVGSITAQIQPFVNETIPQFSDIITQAGDAVGDWAQDLDSFDLSSITNNLKIFGQDVEKAMKDVTKSMDYVPDSGEQVQMALDGVIVILGFLGTGVSRVSSIVLMLAGVVWDLAIVFRDSFEAINDVIHGNFKAAAQDMAGIGDDIKNNTLMKMSEGAAKTSDAFADMTGRALQNMGSLADGTAKKSKEASDALQMNMKQGTDGVNNETQRAKDLASVNTAGLTASVSNNSSKAKDDMASNFGLMPGIVSSYTGQSRDSDKTGELASKVQTNSAVATQAMKDQLSQMPGIAAGQSQGSVDAIVNKNGDMKNAGSSNGQAAVDGVSSKSGDAKSAGKKIAKSTADGAKNNGNKGFLASAGEWIGDTITSAIGTVLSSWNPTAIISSVISSSISSAKKGLSSYDGMPRISSVQSDQLMRSEMPAFGAFASHRDVMANPTRSFGDIVVNITQPVNNGRQLAREFMNEIARTESFN